MFGVDSTLDVICAVLVVGVVVSEVETVLVTDIDELEIKSCFKNSVKVNKSLLFLAALLYLSKFCELKKIQIYKKNTSKFKKKISILIKIY